MSHGPRCLGPCSKFNAMIMFAFLDVIQAQPSCRVGALAQRPRPGCSSRAQAARGTRAPQADGKFEHLPGGAVVGSRATDLLHTAPAHTNMYPHTHTCLHLHSMLEMPPAFARKASSDHIVFRHLRVARADSHTLTLVHSLPRLCTHTLACPLAQAP